MHGGKWENLWTTNQFAIGIIHELTNHATACWALTDTLERSLPPGAAADLAAQLKRNMRSCAHLITESQRLIEDQRTSSTDLNAKVDFAIRILGHVIKPGIQLDVWLDPTVEGLRLKTAGIENILAVLLVHMRIALGDGGAINVETGFVQFDSPRRTRLAKLMPGDYATVKLTSTDDGDSVHNWAQWLAEDFGEDSAIPGSRFLHTLLSPLDAQIDVAHRPCFGDELTLYLPVIGVRAPVDPAEIEAGKWHVLVVEENHVLREGIQGALEQRGFRVTALSSAEKALQQFPNAKEIDLLITDAVIGRMNGWDLAKRLQSIRPELSVIFISGYASAAGFDPDQLPSNASFLRKPFEIDQLLEQIRACLPTESYIA